MLTPEDIADVTASVQLMLRGEFVNVGTDNELFGRVVQACMQAVENELFTDAQTIRLEPVQKRPPSTRLPRRVCPSGPAAQETMNDASSILQQIMTDVAQIKVQLNIP